MIWGKGTFLENDVLVAFDGDNVCALYISGDTQQFLRDFSSLTPSTQNDVAARAILDRIFRNDPTVKPLFIKASELELAVWNALLKIPSGRTCTYTDIAAAIGRPTAVRAVASAIGRNPVSILVPCHRVLRLDGSMGGYRWGLDIKRSLLARESRTKA